MQSHEKVEKKEPSWSPWGFKKKKKNHPCYHVEKNLQRTSGRQGWLELKAGEIKSIRGGCTPGVEQKWFAHTLQMGRVKSLKDHYLVFILSMWSDRGTIDQAGVL